MILYIYCFFLVFGSIVNIQKQRRFQNYAIAYKTNNSTNIFFGLIKTYFKISDRIFCIVQKLCKDKSISKDENFESKIDDFFAICSLRNELDMINIENILNKCVLLKNNEEYFISICNIHCDPKKFRCRVSGRYGFETRNPYPTPIKIGYDTHFETQHSGVRGSKIIIL